MAKKRRSGRKLRRGECKTVKQRNGCTIQLCNTGRGRTGHQFKKGTKRCPSKRRR